MLRFALLLALLSSLAVLQGCGDDPATGSVVVGVTSDYIAGTHLDRLQVVMKADGQVLSDQSLALGNSAGKTNFPAEFAFDGVEDGAALEIRIEGYAPDGRLRVIRSMQTTAAADTRKLVRIHLEQLCRIAYEDDPDDGVPGAPSCNEPSETCIAGGCASSDGKQEDYADDWASAFGDVCKPVGGGAPLVIVGQGQSDYRAAEDGELAQIEAGTQGGHHIWISARVQNIHQSGSITEVGGELPGLGLSITPLKVIFTLDQDEGGFCKIYGLRFQLDVGGQDVNTMLGQQAQVYVTVSDIDDATATGQRTFTLSDDIQ